MKLQRYEKELAGLKDRVKMLEELIEEEKGNDGNPKMFGNYYFVEIGKIGEIVCVETKEYVASESDNYYWNFCHGSTNKAKVEWTIKHIELVNEIKKYTRPFNTEEENWCFVRTFKYGVEELSMNRYACTDVNSSYGYFKSENEINKFKYNHTEEYILNFLFTPRDEDYKSTMDWLAEQEELENE